MEIYQDAPKQFLLIEAQLIKILLIRKHTMGGESE